MKIRTLRIIDLWVGRPICWLITALYFAKGLLVKKTPPANPRQILFIKLFGAGSIVLAYPTVRAAQRRFPEAELYFLTFSANRPVLALLGAIPDRNIYTVRNDSLLHLLLDICSCLNSLIRKKLDVIIDLEFFSRFTAILSFALRSQLRIGFYGFHTEGLRRGRFINSQVNYNHTLHTARAFFTLLRPLGVGQESFDAALPVIPPTPAYPGNILSLLPESTGAEGRPETTRWLAINPNSSDLIALRRWPEEHFVGLALRLLEEFADYGIIFIGSKEEKAYVDTLVATIKGEVPTARIANLAGLTTLAELLDLFHLIELFITNDSGPAHLAALTRVKTITLFGPETPELYAPLNDNSTCLYLGLDCQPCITIYNGKHSHCRDNQCLKQLTIDRVFKLAATLIAAPSQQEAKSLETVSNR